MRADPAAEAARRPRLARCAPSISARRRAFRIIADPVLDPINFGFMTSLERYAQLRRARPDVEILMGTGNLTELTDADSGGVTAVLLGICAELKIRNVLIVQVSPHTRRTVEEHDAARRLMYRAREDGNPAQGLRQPAPVAARRAPLSRHARADRRGGRERQGFELPHRGGGRRPAHLQSRRSPHRRRSVRIIRKAGRREGRRATPSISATSWPRRRLRARSANAMRRTARSIGAVAADRKSDDLTQHAPEGATLKAARKEKQDAAHRRNDRDDDEREG